jgi:hypothetical protein
MRHSIAQLNSTWTEDTALLRSNRSAGPGAETEGRAASLPPAFTRLRDQHQSAKPSRHDAAISSTERASQLANANRSKFQIPLNQDRLPRVVVANA